MSQVSTNTHISRNLWFSMLISVVFPTLFGFILSISLPNWGLIHYPFHAMVESVGSLSALIISVIMIVMINNKVLPDFYIWVASALIAMGILDGFHAVLHSGVSFVWLHSIATLIGGITFAAVWLPQSLLKAIHKKNLLMAFIIISITIGISSILFPESLPVMINAGEFSVLARILNITGGIGFLVGSAFFVNLHLKDFYSNKQRQNEDLVFANHCLLFGMAGILFEISVIWDAGWWWWHVLRLAAYFIVLVYFFTIFKKQQDILTHNKVELEKRVHERTKELEKASNAKSDFLTSMSHELRTPLNAILGFSQLLNMDKSLQERQVNSVHEIIEAGHHLLYLVNEVLDLTKIEEESLELDIQEVDINSIIKECIITLTPLAIKNNVELINNSESTGITKVNGDKLRLKQVIINLISNAIKYNNENGKAFVYTEIINYNKVRISIKDTGPGITEELQNKLFTPFERLNHKNGNIEGAGIGLVLSKKLIESMGGNIGMHSTPGQGCTFYFELSSYE